MYPFPTLPPRLSSTVFAELRAALPPPPDDSAEALDSRDMMAMASVAALGPIDITEAVLAAQVVAAEAHARDAMRLINTYRVDVQVVLRCRAQAASMIRTMHRSLAVLHRIQAMRPLAIAPATGLDQAEPVRVAPLAADMGREDGPPAADDRVAEPGTTGGDGAPPAASRTMAAPPVPDAAPRPGKRASGMSSTERAPRPASEPSATLDADASDGWTGWREWTATGPGPRASVPLARAEGDGRAA